MSKLKVDNFYQFWFFIVFYLFFTLNKGSRALPSSNNKALLILLLTLMLIAENKEFTLEFVNYFFLYLPN